MEIYANTLHEVAIGIISDILLDVCEYCIGCYSILWDIVDVVLGGYGIYWMLADIALGLSEKCPMLEVEFNRFSLTLRSGRRLQRLLCCSEFTPKGGVNICHYEHCFLLVLWVRRVFVATGFHWKRWEAIWRYFLQFWDYFDETELREVFLSWGKCFWRFQDSWNIFDVSE